MSDTYQSRVFSFISKRTNRLKDSCAQGLRHLKVAVVWTGQVLLYPLHLLAQTAKLLTHQLPATAQKSLPQPSPQLQIEQALTIVAAAGYEITNTDRPSIVVDDWSYIDDEIWRTGHGNAAVVSREISYQPQTIDRPQITKQIVRGLSSLLSDRSIVLVTTENEILDVLNVFQQQEIRRRIGVDLEVNWHRWQQDRLQYRRAHNLSGDRSDLLLASNDPEYLTLLSSAELSIDPERATLFDRFQNWLDSFKPKSEDRSPSVITPRERVHPQLTADSYAFTPQPPRFDRPIPDRGQFNPSIDRQGRLNPSALRSASELPQLPPVIDRSTAISQVTTRSQLTPTWLRNWWNYYRDYLYIPPPEGSQIVHQPAQSEFQLIPLDPPPNQTTEQYLARSTARNLTDRQKQGRKLEFNPEWLDVESEDLGTSRSLFQQILMWLDGLMLKIENWLIKTWEFITNKLTHN